MPQPCLEAALQYLRLGWSVVPLCPADHAAVPAEHARQCQSPGAAPLWSWQQSIHQRPTESLLRLLWNRIPAGNVGIVLGPISNLLAIDIQGATGESMLRQITGARTPPDTLAIATPGGGRCLLFQWPPGLDENIATGVGPVRLLGMGSLIVAPPSRAPDGDAWTWKTGHTPGDLPVAPCPPWLPALIASPSPRMSAAIPGGMLSQSRPVVSTRRFTDIPSRGVEWLWPRWIPLSKITMIDGDPGLGKSTVLLDLAARVSNLGIMPDQSQGARGNVVLMSAEDAAEDTIKPRLSAAGADENRIIELSHLIGSDEERPLEIPADLPFIEEVIQANDVRLFIIDPLLAFLCGADANKDQAVRRVLYKLSIIAERHRCAVLCMRHLNKSGSQKAIYRGNSSIGAIGHARAGLLVAQDPDDACQCVLAVSKCNLTARPPSLRFGLEPFGEVCRIRWGGASAYHADQLVRKPPSAEAVQAREASQSKVEQATSILVALLEQTGGRVPIKIARAELAGAGLHGSSVDRAIKKLGLSVCYSKDQPGRRTYFWTVPAPRHLTKLPQVQYPQAPAIPSAAPVAPAPTE